MKILKIFTKYRITELNLYKTFANQLVVSISNFISTILVLRILGLENFGIFSIAWSILLLTNNILHAVFITPLLNIAPKLNNDEKKIYINNSFFLVSIFCILNAFICFLIFSFFGDYIGLKIFDLKFSLIFSVLILLNIFYEFSRRVFYALREINQINKFDFLKNGMQLLLLLVIYITNLSNIYLVIICFLSSISFTIIMARDFINFNPLKIYKVNLTFSRNLRMSRWLIPSSFLYWFNLNIFTIFCATFLGPSSAGILKIMSNLFSIVGICLQGLENWAQVEFAMIFSENGFYSLKKILKKFIFYILVPLAICLIFVNGNYIFIGKLIYGIDLTSYRFEILIFSLAVVLNTINQPFKYFMNALEKTAIKFYGELVAAVIISLSGYKLIQSFNLTGAILGIGLNKLSIFILYLIGYIIIKRKHV